METASIAAVLLLLGGAVAATAVMVARTVEAHRREVVAERLAQVEATAEAARLSMAGKLRQAGLS